MRKVPNPSYRSLKEIRCLEPGDLHIGGGQENTLLVLLQDLAKHTQGQADMIESLSNALAKQSRVIDKIVGLL